MNIKLFKKYYSTGEIAQILQISRVAVFKRIKTGKIKADKVGRNYIVSYEHLLEALGNSIGKEKKQKIDAVVDKATKEYEVLFKLLGKE